VVFVRGVACNNHITTTLMRFPVRRLLSSSLGYPPK